MWRTFFECASWVIFVLATIALLRWTNWCLCCCCVSLSEELFKAPAVGLDLAQIASSGSVSGAMVCCCRNARKMITKRIGKCWRLYSELQVKMEWVTANLHVEFELNTAAYSCTAYSCRRFQQSCDFSMSVRWCLFVYRDILSWMTADISCLINIKRTFRNGKDVWWCLSPDIARMLTESHANYRVPMYS